jgi:hypothetical protein
MNQVNDSTHSSRSLGRILVAGLVLLIAGYVVLKLVIGIVLAVALPVAFILAVLAVIWAFKTLL